MIKYYLKSNGQEVKVGDTIKVSSQTNTPFGVGTTTIHVTMTQDLIPMLLEHDVIEKRETSEKKDLKHYIRRVARRFDMTFPEAESMLSTFVEAEPVVAFTMLLKEISLHMNKDVDISKLPKVYVVSTVNGKVCEIQKKDIKTYAHFAAFKSKEQAYEALELLKGLHQHMYGK